MENTSTTSSTKQAPFSGIYYEHNTSESAEHKAILERVKQFSPQGKMNADLKKTIETGKPVETQEPEIPEHIKSRYNTSEYRSDGLKVFVISPKEGKTKKVVLHLHGGGYLYGITPRSWSLLEKWVVQFKCTVIMPDYPLSPKTFVDSFNFIEPIYKKLVVENDPKDVILAGESAGAGFALGLAMKLKKDDIPQPSHIILSCPWLDVSCTNPKLPEFEKYELFVTVDWMKDAGALYARGHDIHDYRVSPINGDVEGLGRVSLFVSQHEIMYADTEKLRAKFNEKEIPIDYYAYPNMSHCFPAHDIPEAEVALKQTEHCFL